MRVVGVVGGGWGVGGVGVCVCVACVYGLLPLTRHWPGLGWCNRQACQQQSRAQWTLPLAAFEYVTLGTA